MAAFGLEHLTVSGTMAKAAKIWTETKPAIQAVR